MAKNSSNQGQLSPTCDEITQTWDKIARRAKKSGFREGATDGRENVFQMSFDEGYFEGFRTAFVLGKYQGALRANSLLSSTTDESNEPLLQHSKRGLCQLCKNPELLKSNTETIKSNQTTSTNKLLSTLHTKYSNVVNFDLPSTLA